MKLALRVILILLGMIFAFGSLLIPASFKQVRKNQMLLSDMQDMVHAIQSFKSKTMRLPNEDELSKIEDSIPRRYSLRYHFHFGVPPSQPDDKYPKEPKDGGWILWYWRGEWSEYYSSWNDHYSLKDQLSPSDFYGPLIWAPIISTVCFGLAAFLPIFKSKAQQGAAANP